MKRREARPTDEEMDEQFTERGFDGCWSLTTKLSIRAVAGEHLPLHLNYLWALTPQNFRCPICQRSKPYLLRKLRQRVLAHLCIDHDHLLDYLDALAARSCFRGNLRGLYDRHMSFAPLICCNQCNGIDSSVKLRAPQVHRFFTFTPAHKATLLKCYRRSHHWINLERALKIWYADQERFMAHLAELSRFFAELPPGPISTPTSVWSYQRYIDEELKVTFMLKCPPTTEIEEYYTFISRSTAPGGYADES